MPIVEVGDVPEIFFTDIEIELIAGSIARFSLLQERTPFGYDRPTELMLKAHALTPCERVPPMIGKTVFKLSAMGLLLPARAH